ncbi:hypothetical protein BK727_12250 [Bacillus thuringiensis serovar roskildiensis]|uniref:Uncharacterized protein n=1 Tax=Bacillus thuringiensis serovar sooncheon TaxID=180891 RepID=A0A9Q5X1D9_BACTU|nr:hypothetical protein [Bacillus thuringiensis]MEB9661616.1 hypothetical protein [Bacillus cereus]OTW68843.1 hypothetical protein BK707_17440 [Bacillus thuringiensis serovar coreanensis]OTX42661.1 hypothetical protein BK724_25195 [Bacillus thuringiensis serovar sooncheon]OTX54451.1 hypothetical protein BK725_12190 [Bacillus thuringiensis serovar guiyangiensis]OTX69449.1 hypothetical protein BK727_12250 [Bacillus thuringiensis serovar roskildiensis]
MEKTIRITRNKRPYIKEREVFKQDEKTKKSTTPIKGAIEEVEVERLRMENAYLKELTVLVQNKEQLQNKTK